VSSETLTAYLEELRTALENADPALVQDALADTESHLRSALEASREADPTCPEEAAMALAVEAFGTPAEVADSWKGAEAAVGKVLRVPPPPRASVPILGVLWDWKAYTSLLYLLTSVGTGIFAFTWVAAGLSLSAGLAVLVIGVPFFLAFMASTRAIALAEGRLVEALLDVRMPRRARLLPEGAGLWGRAKALLADRTTWFCLLYLSLKLPLGLVAFTVFSILLTLAAGFVFAPFGHWFFGLPVVSSWGGEPISIGTVGLMAMLLLGVLGFIAVLHLARGTGRLLGNLAKLMLVPRG
jgi:hypothetical protein